MKGKRGEKWKVKICFVSEKGKKEEDNRGKGKRRERGGGGKGKWMREWRKWENELEKLPQSIEFVSE